MTFLFLILIAFSASHISGAVGRSTEEGGICSLKNNSASCCARIGTKWTICLVIQVRLNELKAYAALTVNGRIILLQELKVGKFCVPLVPSTTVCLDIYWLDGSLIDKTLDVCTKVSLISPALNPTIDLQCLSFQAGQFSLTGDHRPSTFQLPELKGTSGK